MQCPSGSTTAKIALTNNEPAKYRRRNQPMHATNASVGCPTRTLGQELIKEPTSSLSATHASVGCLTRTAGGPALIKEPTSSLPAPAREEKTSATRKSARQPVRYHSAPPRKDTSRSSLKGQLGATIAVHLSIDFGRN